jgi:hypothetical protein
VSESVAAASAAPRRDNWTGEGSVIGCSPFRLFVMCRIERNPHVRHDANLSVHALPGVNMWQVSISELEQAPRQSLRAGGKQVSGRLHVRSGSMLLKKGL